MRLEFLDENNNVCDVNDILLEMAIDVIYEDDDEITTEGANIDILKQQKAYLSLIKEQMKKFKKYSKNKDFNGSRSVIDETIKIVEKMKKDISSIDSDSITSTIIGGIITSIITAFKTVLIMLIPIVGPPVASIKGFKDAIDMLVATTNKIKNKKEDINRGDFNGYQLLAIKNCDDLVRKLKSLKKYIDKKEKKIKEIEKEQKKKINVKESAEYKEKKLSIYESCQKGEITLEERESLLSDLDKEAVLQECENNEDSSMSNREKCKAVIESLYEKCSNGEITLEEREYLIEKAQSQFLENGNQQSSSNEKDGIDPKQEQEAKKLELELKKAGNQPIGDK